MTIDPNLLSTLKSDTYAKLTLGKKRKFNFSADFSNINPEFVGNFSIHYPSQLEVMAIGVLRSSLLGGSTTVDTYTNNLAHIMATLDTVIDSKPEWFDVSREDLEYSILESVYLRYSEWVATFRRPAKPSETGKPNNGKDSGDGLVDTKGVEGSSN